MIKVDMHYLHNSICYLKIIIIKYLVKLDYLDLQYDDNVFMSFTFGNFVCDCGSWSCFQSEINRFYGLCGGMGE